VVFAGLRCSAEVVRVSLFKRLGDFVFMYPEDRPSRQQDREPWYSMARDLTRQRDVARESQAQLEEENALLLWLLAEAVWKLQLESAKSWAREQAGKPYEGWNVLRRRRVEQHSVWVMGACTCGAKCDGAAGWKQHQYEVGAWVPQKGERVTGKSRGKYDPDPVGEFDSFSYEGTTAIINHVPPRYPAAVSDRTYVDADSLRPAPTEPEEECDGGYYCQSPHHVDGCLWGDKGSLVDMSLTRSQELERDAADMETHGGES
jgi:hypothetical protein